MLRLLKETALIALVVFLLFLWITPTTRAATGVATAEDCKRLEARNIPCDVGKTPYDPKGLGVGKSAEAAREYLKTKLVGAAKARGPRSVTEMGDAYVCRLAEFIKDAENNKHKIEIFSGWRDGNTQSGLATKANAKSKSGKSAYVCQSGASCPHPQGRAADLLMNGKQEKTTAGCNANVACRWAHDNASRFKLVFPLRGNPLEPWHIEPIERSRLPKNAPCEWSGDPATLPPPGRETKPGPPSSDLTKTVREALKPPPMMMMPPPPPPSQPLGSMQSPLGAFQPSQMLPPPQSITSTNLDPKSGPTSSIASKLSALVESPSTESEKKENVVPVVIEGSDTGTVMTKTDKETEQTPSDVVSIQPVGQQTFVSADLATSPVVTPLASQTALQQTLSTLKTALLMLSEYLKPLSINTMRHNVDVGEESYE